MFEMCGSAELQSILFSSVYGSQLVISAALSMSMLSGDVTCCANCLSVLRTGLAMC